MISPGRRRASSRIRSTRVAVGQGGGRRRQLGVAEALRPVRLLGRLERPDERRLAPHRDLDVGPARRARGSARVLIPTWRAATLPDTHVAATISASGEAAA